MFRDLDSPDAVSVLATSRIFSSSFFFFFFFLKWTALRSLGWVVTVLTGGTQSNDSTTVRTGGVLVAAGSWWGCYGLCLGHQPAVLVHTFFFFLFVNSVLVSVSVFMALSTIFHSINSPHNCPLSHSVLLSLISALLILSTLYLFMKTSLSTDVILCGWLGLKHQLTNLLFSAPIFKLMDRWPKSMHKIHRTQACRYWYQHAHAEKLKVHSWS